MLNLAFDVQQSGPGMRTIYSERERLRKNNIIGEDLLDNWAKRSYLYLDGMDTTSRVMYIVQHFMNIYPLDYVSLRVYQDRNPEGVSENSLFYSYRSTLDGMTKEQQNEIKMILTYGLTIAVDYILENCVWMIYKFPDASVNPVWWWKRFHRLMAEQMNKGEFDKLTTWNRRAIEVTMSLVISTLGTRSWAYTDCSEVYLDFTKYALEQIKGCLDNWEPRLVSMNCNMDELFKKFTITDEEIAEAKKERAEELVTIEANERAEAKRIQDEIEEHREYCKAMERLRDARMAAYDRACGRAGCALPYMF